jgi:hypothetical protein
MYIPRLTQLFEKGSFVGQSLNYFRPQRLDFFLASALFRVKETQR